MRIGVFGGSFDPVHNGHLLLADCCLVQAKLDQVRLTPAAEQPLKPHGPNASDQQRVAMLKLAIENRTEFSVSPLEIQRGGPSYTADTLAEMQRLAPTDQFFFLLGADALADFSRWVRPGEICQLATLLIVQRPWTELSSARARRQLSETLEADVRIQVVDMPATSISSTQIRRQIAAGDPAWRASVPDAVAQYIEQQRLYR